MNENDELAKLIVTKIVVELLDFPHVGAAVKRLDRDDHAIFISNLETAVEAVLDVKRSY